MDETQDFGVASCLVQVGYIYSNLRNASDIHVGDTLGLAKLPVRPLPGFEPPKRLVYAGENSQQ